MNTSKIINIILLIFITHLVLINLNFSKIIEFENNSFSIKDYKYEEYTPPLMSNYIKNQESELLQPRDELYKYINGNDYYSDTNNYSNFKSDVMRVDNFYEENNIDSSSTKINDIIDKFT